MSGSYELRLPWPGGATLVVVLAGERYQGQWDVWIDDDYVELPGGRRAPTPSWVDVDGIERVQRTLDAMAAGRDVSEVAA